MPKSAHIPQCPPDVLTELDALAHKQRAEARIVKRAGMVLDCVNGQQVASVARRYDVTPNQVILWRSRFEQDGIKGLCDKVRSGRPLKYGVDLKHKVLAVLEEPPPKGQACWDGDAVAKHLEVSNHAVWRLLRKEGICLQRHRSWCVSTDPEFAAKAADIVGLYLNPPENALVVCVDEKPSIQALERKTGYVETSSGKVVRAYKSTYKRHGTLNLFAALTVASGAIATAITESKRRVEFLAFMDSIVAQYPQEQELHVILDNYCIHKKNLNWLAAHPNVHFHFTPTSASWLNMVEIWFGIMSRKALKGASFDSKDALRKAIEEFIAAYGPKAKPFVWKKREVKGSQLRNTIINLRN